MSLRDEIRQDIKALTPRLIEIRRDIHQHPEMAFREQRTADVVARTLAEAGLQLRTGVGRMGVVGLIEGGEGPCLALRADMDALPIQEETDLPFKSATPGVMHACGHDVHTTVLLGVGLALQKHHQRLRGKVKLVFQPAEEGISGAAAMIQDGVLENPKVSAACAVHVEGSFVWNEVALRYGENLAAADALAIEIIGKGTHGAFPHDGNDPILASAAVIQALQQIVSRRVNPVDAAVVSICAIQGGTAFNIIPERVTMKGTVRTLDEALRGKMEKWIPEVTQQTAAGYGCEAKVTYSRGCPPLRHDRELTSLAEKALREWLGPERVLMREKPMMGAEDFAYFAERVPSTQVVLGIKSSADAPKVNFHQPRFVVDERCIAVGVEAFCAIALGYLGVDEG